jgi:hypothetical protein
MTGAVALATFVLAVLLRGFAVHGHPKVPAYPVSHDCVRVPMWVAPRLFCEHTTGQSVYIYW